MVVVGSCCGMFGNMQNDFDFDYGNGYQKTIRFGMSCIIITKSFLYGKPHNNKRISLRLS